MIRDYERKIEVYEEKRPENIIGDELLMKIY